jgi:rod shape-determining protein MreC
LRFAIFFWISILIFATDYKRNTFATAKSLFGLPRYYLAKLVDFPFSISQDVSKYLVMNSTLMQENAALKELSRLQSIQLQKFHYLELENIRLKNLVNFSENQKDSYRLANIINVELDRFKHQIMLDRGIEQGVFVGQPLISESGIVGSIVAVEKNYSTAILITDVSYAIPVVNLRSGLRAIAIGSGDIKTIDLQHISHTADIEERDVFVTSGIGGKYPPGYIVGTVNAIKRATNYPFATVSLQVTNNINKCKEALLIYPNNNTDKNQS